MIFSEDCCSLCLERSSLKIYCAMCDAWMPYHLSCYRELQHKDGCVMCHQKPIEYVSKLLFFTVLMYTFTHLISRVSETTSITDFLVLVIIAIMYGFTLTGIFVLLVQTISTVRVTQGGEVLDNDVTYIKANVMVKSSIYIFVTTLLFYNTTLLGFYYPLIGSLLLLAF